MRLARTKAGLLLLIALAALAIAAIARNVADDSAGASWTEAQERALQLEVPVAGRLRALQVAQYGPPELSQTWEYRITFIAAEGTEVAAGDPVLRFDTTDLESSLRRHLAARDAASTDYEHRRKDFDADLSQQRLALEEAKAQEQRAAISADVPDELVARSQLEKAQVDLDLARSELEHRDRRIADLGRRSQAELGVLRDRRDRAAAAAVETERSIELMTVRATSAGTVSHRADRRGNKKKVGDSCWRGEQVLEIPLPGALRIDGWIKEAESGGVRIGLPATLSLEAHPDRSFRAKVERIQQTVERRSELDPGAIVRVELSFDDADGELTRPGMRVAGRIELERRERQVAVRVAAVEAGAAGPMVVKKTLFGTVAQPVELGARSGDWVEIRSGLAAGERVVLPR